MNRSFKEKPRRPVLLWALAGVTLTAALGWYILGGGPHELASGPLDTQALGGRSVPLDMNAATAMELDELPGIGPVLAERIVAWREENGPFAGPDDLMAVEGIGPATYEDLAPYIGF